MERDTRRLAIVSVSLGICVATLMPVQAGLLDALKHAGLPWRAIAHGSNVLSFFDAAQNILLFLPLGFLLGSDADGLPGKSPKRAAALCLLFSAAIECAQAWIPGRFPSIWDVTFNSIGSGDPRGANSLA
ncbi:MAG: VanZ family protein [Fibrobacteres bacterium]|nr:VanZ family protein [Fibrobacterota bacterium]